MPPLPPLATPLLKPLLNYGHYAQSVWPHDLTNEEDIAGGKVPAAGGKRSLGAEPTNKLRTQCSYQGQIQNILVVGGMQF